MRVSVYSGLIVIVSLSDGDDTRDCFMILVNEWLIYSTHSLLTRLVYTQYIGYHFKLSLTHYNNYMIKVISLHLSGQPLITAITQNK